MVYIPYNEEDEEEEEEEKNSKKRKKMKSKEKRKKEKEKKAKKNQPPTNQNEEAKLRPGDLVITGSADSSIKIWSLSSGECFHVCRNCNGMFIIIVILNEQI